MTSQPRSLNSIVGNQEIRVSIDLPVAEDFVRQMSLRGFEVEAHKVGSLGDTHEFKFRYEGKPHDLHVVHIDYATSTAALWVKPRVE